MTCGVNVLIVLLEHAILYPEGINAKTSTVALGGSKIGVKSFVLCNLSVISGKSCLFRSIFGETGCCE